MKNVSIHLPSVVVGLGIAALIGVTMGQQGIGPPGVDVRILEPTLDDPVRNAVIVVEGQPYTVPSGRLLVLTAMGSSQVNTGSSSTSLRINGTQHADAWWPTSDATTSILPLPSPLVAPSGTTVEVINGAPGVPDDARAWGYLADG